MTKAEAIRELRKQAGAIKALGATALYLFGSTARNRASAKSDMDIFIDYDPRGRFNALDLVAAKRLLEESLRVEVDLTTRKGLHPLIRKQVEAEDAGFLDGHALPFATHPRHARKHPWNRKGARWKNDVNNVSPG